MMKLSDRATEFQSIVCKGLFTTKTGTHYEADEGITEALALLKKAHVAGGHVYIIGNGGSAAVASHIANDFCNVGKLRASTFNEPSLMTCFANDYGYEHVFSARLATIATSEDLLIAISSSGNSENILRAVDCMDDVGGQTITFSGFGNGNKLRSTGVLNYWLDAEDYGLVEVAHLFVLHFLSDMIARTWDVKTGLPYSSDALETKR